MNKKEIKLINKYFYYKNENGKKFLGYEGMKNIKHNKHELQLLINSYLEIEERKKQNTFGLFGITTKIHKTFGKNNKINNVFVLENYLFPFKRKSLASYYMFLSKEKSDILAIDYFRINLFQKFIKLHKFYKFDYIGFLESSNKNRKIQIMDIIKDYFLERLEKQSIIHPPSGTSFGKGRYVKILEINKIDTNLEQKKIFNLDLRIKNACDSFSVGEVNNNSNILLIDDVIDSGATINAIARKIREKQNVNQIIALAGIGSLKGKIKINDI